MHKIMKKNIIRFLAIAFSCSLAWSCVSLDEYPKAIAAETFYSNVEECQAAVAAAVNDVTTTFRGNWYNLMEPWSDYNYARESSSFAFMNDFDGLNVTGRGWSDEAWNGFYKGIRDCNCALAKIPNAERMSDADKNAYIGELKFIRALGYFFLVRFWGKVPLRTEENINDFDMTTSSVEDIYKLILSDLEFAVKYCPAKPRCSRSECLKEPAFSCLS